MSSAPIELALLEAVLAPLGQSRTMPASAYLSDEVFAWEQEYLFEDNWIHVGRGSELCRAGDQRAVRVGRDGALLVRPAEEERLSAFYNVCRHRGHELLPGGEPPVNRRAVRCPYHGW